MENSYGKILIVDDVPINIEVLVTLLSKENYTLGYATSGTQALSNIKNNDYDLILLDVMMPDIGGFEVCSILKADAKTKDIPIIFLTGKTEPDSIIRGFEVGGQDYITKPFNSYELLSRVRTHIKLKKHQEEMYYINQILEDKVDERTHQLSNANFELIKLNEKISSLEKAKHDFLVLINHELRTPIHSIISLSNLLEYKFENTEHFNSIKLLSKSAERLFKLSKLSLLITEIKSEKYIFSFHKMPVKSIILDSIAKLHEKIDSKNIKINSNMHSNDLYIVADPELVQDIFTNILDNAINFSKASGEINITSTETENVTIISISDNGPGFPKNTLENMFELFLTNDIEHHMEGLGLSLIADKLIMTAHSGNIEIKNKPDGGALINLVFKKS